MSSKHPSDIILSHIFTLIRYIILKIKYFSILYYTYARTCAHVFHIVQKDMISSRVTLTLKRRQYICLNICDNICVFPKIIFLAITIIYSTKIRRIGNESVNFEVKCEEVYFLEKTGTCSRLKRSQSDPHLVVHVYFISLELFTDTLSSKPKKKKVFV